MVGTGTTCLPSLIRVSRAFFISRVVETSWMYTVSEGAGIWSRLQMVPTILSEVPITSRVWISLPARAVRTSRQWSFSIKMARFTAWTLFCSVLALVPARILVPSIRRPSSMMPSQ